MYERVITFFKFIDFEIDENSLIRQCNIIVVSFMSKIRIILLIISPFIEA